MRDFFIIVCLDCDVMRSRSCATIVCEPCQAGNRAALSIFDCVPQQTDFELSFPVTGGDWFQN